MAIKRILIPSELDELSEKVMRFAVSLAEKLHTSEIVLLNLVPYTKSFSISGDIFTSDGDMVKHYNLLLMEKHQKLVEEEAEKFTSDKVSIKPVVRFSDSKTSLNQYMEVFGADLLVCGSRDEQSFLQFLFGSDTGTMVSALDYPLIVIQEEADAGEIQNILVPIDISEEDQRGLTEIVTFSAALTARMQLLHVLTDDSYSADYALKRLKELAIGYMFDNYDINVVNDDSLEDGIRSFARKNNSDMIAVLSQGRGKIHKLIFGSSTEDIIKETNKPVFVSKNRLTP
jgi:nucleotide-binding universal stress UspA family protein